MTANTNAYKRRKNNIRLAGGGIEKRRHMVMTEDYDNNALVYTEECEKTRTLTCAMGPRMSFLNSFCFCLPLYFFKNFPHKIAFICRTTVENILTRVAQDLVNSAGVVTPLCDVAMCL